jgi:hypothetical protein
MGVFGECESEGYEGRNPHVGVPLVGPLKGLWRVRIGKYRPLNSSRAETFPVMGNIELSGMKKAEKDLKLFEHVFR